MKDANSTTIDPTTVSHSISLFFFVDCNTTIPGLFDKSRWILDQFQYSALASQLHSLDFLSSLFLAHQWPVFC